MKGGAVGLALLVAGCGSASAPEPRVDVLTLEASWTMLCGATVLEYAEPQPDRVMVALPGAAIVVGARRSDVTVAHQQCVQRARRVTTGWTVGELNGDAATSSAQPLWLPPGLQQNAFCAFEGKIWPARTDGCHREDMPR